MLSDGDIHVDKIQIQLLDCVVPSLLEMPECEKLVRNWSLMLRAIRNENPQQDASEKLETATQRVLLRMLATSVKLNQEQETSSNSNGKKPTRKRKKSDQEDDDSLEALSVALMKNLSNLLTDFRSDVMALRELCKLPLTISSAVLGLPARKSDFQSLLKILCQLYIDSTDEVVLQNIAATLSQWIEGDHSRLSEVKMQVKRLSRELQNRLVETFRENDSVGTKGKRISVAGVKQRSSKKAGGTGLASPKDIFKSSPEVDAEYSISLMMMRWKILLEGCDSNFLFDEATEDDEEDDNDVLFNMISEAMGKRLSDRKPVYDKQQQDDATAVNIPTIWNEDEVDPNLHEVVAGTIDLSLKVLLLIISHELADTFEGGKMPNINSDDMSVDEENLLVLRLRDRMVKLLGLCFDQYLAPNDDVAYSDEHAEFAARVQASAARVASDLRTLFPQDFAEASAPVRKALALTASEEVSHLLGGSARHLQSVEAGFSEEGEDPDSFIQGALLPLVRVCSCDASHFYRKELALVLAHISDKSVASKTVFELAKILKKVSTIVFFLPQFIY
jgi:hypothetical protein